MDSMWNQWLWQLQAFCRQQAEPASAALLVAALQEDASRLAPTISILTRAAQQNDLAPPESWWLQSLEAIRNLALAKDDAFDDQAIIESLAELHAALGGAPLAQARLLQVLAESGRKKALENWVQRMVEQPPDEDQHLVLAFSPLFTRLDYDPAWIYPGLLEALHDRRTAPAVLDLANFLVREGICTTHPASQRRLELANLLGEVAQRLSRLEESGVAATSPPDRIAVQQTVSDSVALGVSLCDALALIGDPEVVGKLHQAMEPAHRRLRTEAAAAITRLGQPSGAAALVELAAEPVARLRVLHYASELGVLDQVPPEFRTEKARAEASLAAWLAEPLQFGVAPSRLELLDHRWMYWPGGEDPESCYLFSFEYSLPGGGAYCNVGMSGPLVYAFAADLIDHPAEDIYAAFAGWQCDHEDIYEVAAQNFEPAHQLEAVRLQRRLSDQGYSDIKPELLGFFLGQKVLVARAKQGLDTGLAVVDEQTIAWSPDQADRRNLEPQDAYCMYKGRQLIRSFNE